MFKQIIQRKSKKSGSVLEYFRQVKDTLNSKQRHEEAHNTDVELNLRAKLAFSSPEDSLNGFQRAKSSFRQRKALQSKQNQG